MLDQFYVKSRDDRAPWGKLWCGPNKFECGVDTLIAQVAKQSEGGQSVDVYCCARPARLLRLVVAPDPDSVGNPQPGYEVELGSGMTQLAVDLVTAITGGMIAVSPLIGGKNDKP